MCRLMPEPRNAEEFSRHFLKATIYAVLIAGGATALTVFVARHGRSGDSIEHGRTVYEARCAACHGAKLEGQPDWRHLNAMGRLPAPPLDGTGHAWRHSDAELAHIIASSVLDIAGPGYETDMPAFGKDLSKADIRALVAFIKSRWSSNIQAAQAFLNPDHAGMPAKVDGDWRLPPDCEEPVRTKPPGPAAISQ